MSPEHYAISLLKRLNIKSFPINPYLIADALEIPVIENAADNYRGLLLKKGNEARIIINSNIRNQGQKSFTLAHEIGHYSIPSHSKSSSDYQCLPNYFNLFEKNPHKENEANQFASELLLPEKFLRPILPTYKPEFESIKELSDDCGTSLTATALRFAKLSDECCALLAISANKVKWFQKSLSFPFWIDHGAPILPGTLTASYSLHDVPLTADTQKIHATYWFKGRGIDSSTFLHESCVPMPDYGVILTMLWFAEPPYDRENAFYDSSERRYEQNPWRWHDSADD